MGYDQARDRSAQGCREVTVTGGSTPRGVGPSRLGPVSSRSEYSWTYHFEGIVETDDKRRVLFFATKREATAWAKQEAQQTGGRYFVWSH